MLMVHIVMLEQAAVEAGASNPHPDKCLTRQHPFRLRQTSHELRGLKMKSDELSIAVSLKKLLLASVSSLSVSIAFDHCLTCASFS